MRKCLNILVVICAMGPIAIVFQNCSGPVAGEAAGPVPPVLTQGAEVEVGGGGDGAETESVGVTPVEQLSQTVLSANRVRPLDRVLVNHDLWAFTRKPNEQGGASLSSYVSNLSATESVDEAVKAIVDNQDEVGKLGASFSMNGTYGAHQLWYWGLQEKSYKEWLRALLGADQFQSYFNSGKGKIDVLLVDKIKDRDLLKNILRQKTATAPFLISVRMNDHHHLTGAVDFLEASAKLPVSEASFSRRIAALSPEYRTFLSKGFVLSGVEKPGRGKTGDGIGCDRGEEGAFSYHLDFSNSEVISQKILELEDLFARYDALDGVELDFMRANCYFPRGFPAAQRLSSMNRLFAAVFAAKRDFARRTGRAPALVIRVPLDESAKSVHGIDVAALAKNPLLDGVIFAFSRPYLRSQVIPHDVQFRHKDLKLYYELYGTSDQRIVDGKPLRRPVTRQEVSTAAYEALQIGYDGVSLFNFHYIFSENSRLKGEYVGQKFSWRSMLPYLSDAEKVRTDVAPTYFFGERNAEGDFSIAKPGDSASVTFRYANRKRKVENEGAILRIIHEQSASPDAAAWKEMIFHVKINGVLISAAGGSALVPGGNSFGRDPVRFYQDATAAPWGPRASKLLSIPQEAFKDGANRIEVILIRDPRGLFKAGSRLQFQLTM